MRVSEVFWTEKKTVAFEDDKIDDKRNDLRNI